MNGMAYVRILRDLREDADKTQTQIAEVLGTSQTMYARYERGANEMPIHHLITLSKYYASLPIICWDSVKNGKHGLETPVRVFCRQHSVVCALRHSTFLFISCQLLSTL
jgi:transcriptional regulator with XRE-family HTH domain